MRVTVFGAGALGSVIGGLMVDSHEVTLICREDHAREINADGLWLNGMVEKKTFPHASTDTSGLPAQDLVIVTVKAYDTRKALHSIHPLLGKDTSVLIVQNGLTILNDVKQVHPEALIGTTNIGAQYIGPGHVKLTGKGEMVIGGPEDVHDLGIKALESFHSTGIPCRWSEDMTRDVWRKAVISSCINPLTAITRKPNAVLIDDRRINDLARICYEESCRVAVSLGRLEANGIKFTEVEDVAKATAMNRSSMLQDVERGKRTEIENINGEIVRLGSQAGLDVRFNEILVSLVSAIATGHHASNV